MSENGTGAPVDQMPLPDQSAPAAPPGQVAQPAPPNPRHRPSSIPALVLAAIVAGIVILSAWYLTRPVPLMIQGEADSTRIDMAARVDGRLAKLLVERGQMVAAGQKLLQIDNPELLAKLEEAKAGEALAEAELARIHAGTRAETIAVRKAGIDRAAADVALAQQTYDRYASLAANQNASQQKLDEATDALRVAQRSYDQAKLAYQEAVAGFTPEEVKMAEAKVVQADAAVKTLQSLVDQLVVTAPGDTQVYEINIEEGEVVGPGIPLMSLVDMNDVWLRFDLREDLIKHVKLGDHIMVRIPALGDRQVQAEIKLIASKGEYAGWRATRATGDFDLRTFAIRAYPVEKIPELRPGMSAYADWSDAVQ
ncbi:MAG TPA: efflux RND transporter periplasmic adaptor subunit [Terriglobales bacterium]|nr:efflux RND transporter periplasmic adaptor subunit [Terriglobales bacterium]